jgi:hypothetical protein
MMKLVYGAVAAIVISAASVVATNQDQPVEVHNGFLTGRQFLDLPAGRMRAYAAGLVDGVFLAPLYGAPKARVARLEACVEGMTDTQVSAIISQHLKARPETWHQHAHTSFFRAMLDRCPPGEAQTESH